MKAMRDARVARKAAAASDPGVSIDDLDTEPTEITQQPRRAAAVKRTSPTRAKRGRPAKPIPRQAEAKRPAHAAPRASNPIRRDPTVQRGPMRDQHSGRVVIMRNGKAYTRRSVATGDKFHIDDADIPDGMSYQWVATHVAGAEQRNSIASFSQNGWESVPLSRYPGRYAEPDAKGAIVMDGLMLVERPIELTEEARGEEIAAAKNLIRTRNDQFVPKLPEALERRGTGLRAKRSIEGMPPDIGRPAYEVAVDEGLV
jgi:hypothetical protein